MNARTILAAASLLLLGAVAGLSGDRIVHAHHGAARTGAQFPADPVAMFHRELDLTEAQQERINAILARTQPRIDAAWTDARARIKVSVDSIVAEVAAELDSTQLPRFYRLVERVHGNHTVETRRGH